jgi:phosphoadenosine phosphosulfate reductase family protein
LIESTQQRTQVVSFGGGVNSSAMCLGLYERQEKIALVLFSDTGGEKPETYRHVETFSKWLEDHGMPAIKTVRRKITLEAHCEKYKTLPSIVIGLRQCSHGWKVQPQEAYLAKFHSLKDHLRLIGIDAGEAHRKTELPNTRYPLIEWAWDRARCIEALSRHNVPVPVKSACFFCPASKKSQIIQLSKEHPDLYQRAVAMETRNEALRVRGLAKTRTWSEIVEANDTQGSLFGDNMPCVCFDGDTDDDPEPGSL